MVLYSLTHNLYLFWREPSLEPGIHSQYPSTCNVMYGSWPIHTQVMVCRYCIRHVDIDTKLPCQNDAVLDDAGDMEKAMALSETGISGQNLLVDKLHKRQVYLLNHDSVYVGFVL